MDRKEKEKERETLIQSSRERRKGDSKTKRIGEKVKKTDVREQTHKERRKETMKDVSHSISYPPTLAATLADDSHVHKHEFDKTQNK